MHHSVMTVLYLFQLCLCVGKVHWSSVIFHNFDNYPARFERQNIHIPKEYRNFFFKDRIGKMNKLAGLH